jgi:hypothetical protein
VLEGGIREGIAGDKSVRSRGSGTGDTRSALVVSKRGEVDGLVVRHCGSGERSVRVGTCENFHKSGAAAENSPRPWKSLETDVLE